MLCAGGVISNYGDLHPSDMALDTGVVFGMCFDFFSNSYSHTVLGINVRLYGTH